ncbi:hypothetical protein DB32_006327 [Sandaracinus amylolyticus]|uniref:Uncharacterized protein n=1 Tax=Sandaracinus amylolyticus TaxID=927083 RepID=A0A0F6YKW9_9BACT|nr:hypothetical protein DB32_006327 [Sandaracinus amylolyticus]
MPRAVLAPRRAAGTLTVMAILGALMSMPRFRGAHAPTTA